MLIDKQFDQGYVIDTIDKICAVSEFVDPITKENLSASEVKHYLQRSKRRLSVVSKEFKRLGFKEKIQEFKFRGETATNALFYRGNSSEEIILFVAHHDYIAGLGADDNATALATMIELASFLEENESRVIFASFDLEEFGLLGSRNFVSNISNGELQKFSGVIALECLGSEKDVVICRKVAGAKSDPKLISDLQHAARNSGNHIFIESFDWFNADHVPFAERGIKTVEICSFDSEKNYKDGPASDAIVHSNRDIPKNILQSPLKIGGEILLQFLKDS